jgi:benzoylformate decarboxylase
VPIPEDARAQRRHITRARCQQRVQDWAAKVRDARGADGLSALLVAAELRELLPADAIFVDESISNRPAFVNVLDFRDPLSYFNVNGLSLGYSPAAAVGIHQALPGRRIVNVVGDGSLMYYPQALWNAATAGAPVLFVVLNNGSYHVLKLITERMGGPWGAGRHAVPGLDLDGAAIDFVGLSASLGVPSERVTAPAGLRGALQRGLEATGPHLVEIDLRQR